MNFLFNKFSYIDISCISLIDISCISYIKILIYVVHSGLRIKIFVPQHFSPNSLIERFKQFIMTVLFTKLVR